MDDSGSIDSSALSAGLTELRASLGSRSGLHETLEHVTNAACRLFGVSGAGLMVADEEQILRYVVATDEPGRTLEGAQAEIGHGPCVDSLVYARLVTTRDLRDDDRWPGLADRVDPAVRAVLGVPVQLAGTTIGSLNVYHSEPYAWSEQETEALPAFANLLELHVEAALRGHHQGRLIEQLQHALDSRVQIERAVGLLMGRHGIDAVTAFNRLRRDARSRRLRVVVLAAELLDDASRGISG